MTAKLRAAAQAAMEFAEFDAQMNNFVLQECEQAIDVLRAALAEPTVNEPEPYWADDERAALAAGMRKTAKELKR